MSQLAVTMIAFLAAAVAVNALLYGVVTWVYFRDKHRVDPPKPDAYAPRFVGSPFSEEPISDTERRELDRAA
jgi:hypothetical protein